MLNRKPVDNLNDAFIAQRNYIVCVTSNSDFRYRKPTHIHIGIYEKIRFYLRECWSTQR